MLDSNQTRPIPMSLQWQKVFWKKDLKRTYNRTY
jgi:hypothetical protein